jgi:alpha-acetolactate decarboxylase
LSDDKKVREHLLDFQLKPAMLKLDRIQEFEVQLPDTDGFQESEFKTDRTEQVTEIEG